MQEIVVFIGDCAPLSFFQTVRQIVISRVDPHAFAPQTSRFSMLENTSTVEPSITPGSLPEIDPQTVGGLLSTFASVVSREEKKKKATYSSHAVSCAPYLTTRTK